MATDVVEVPPISTQISALAKAAPDAPAVTCEGRTLSRAELDASTNRLARAYAELGVGVGDYVSIAMPNSIEWIQAVVACWKLGAVPQPLSARLPDAEFTGILDLKSRALVVGRADTRGVIPSVAMDFTPDDLFEAVDREVRTVLDRAVLRTEPTKGVIRDPLR